MGEDDFEIDKQLLLLKYEYAQDGSDKEAIARQAQQLREENPGIWTIKSTWTLEYFTIYDYTDKISDTLIEAIKKYGKNSDIGKMYFNTEYPWNDGMETFRRYLFFYAAVGRKQEYDVKYKEGWQHSHFLYNGKVIDKDTPGNIIYGYLGKDMGFSDRTLLLAGCRYCTNCNIRF